MDLSKSFIISVVVPASVTLPLIFFVLVIKGGR